MSKALGGILAILATLFLCITLLFQFVIYLIAASGLLSLGVNFLYGPGTAQASYNIIVIAAGITSIFRVISDIDEGLRR